MCKLSRSIISCILSLIILVIAANAIWAEGSEETEAAIVPKVEIDNDNWIIVSFSDKVSDKESAIQELNAQLAATLDKMGSPEEKSLNLLRGSGYMSDTKQQNTHGSYVSASFGTNASWTSSPASFSGSSNSYWHGLDPLYCYQIGRYHMLETETWLEVFQSVPTGWINNMYWATSNLYYATDVWYLGTSWSGLTVTYSDPRIMLQNDTAIFNFYSGDDPILNPSSNLYYGY